METAQRYKQFDGYGFLFHFGTERVKRFHFDGNGLFWVWFKGFHFDGNGFLWVWFKGFHFDWNGFLMKERESFESMFIAEIGSCDIILYLAWPATTQFIYTLLHFCFPQPYFLPTIRGKHQDLKSISPDTVCEFPGFFVNCIFSFIY